MCVKGGFNMQAIWKVDSSQKSIRKRDGSFANRRFDTRVDIARKATRTVNHMTNNMAKSLTKDIMNMVYTEERREHER